MSEEGTKPSSDLLKSIEGKAEIQYLYNIYIEAHARHFRYDIVSIANNTLAMVALHCILHYSHHHKLLLTAQMTTNIHKSLLPAFVA